MIKERRRKMDLMKFKTVDNAFKTTVLASAVCCLIMGIAFVVSSIYLSNKIDSVLTKALVFDTSGQVYGTASINAVDMRKYEYEDHIKRFVNLWYSFDESTYERNIEEALHLIGNQGKLLINEYNDVNMLNSLIQKNLRYGIIIKDLRIDMQTIPVSGEILFTQTGYRAKGSIARDISAKFTLYDVSRSAENSHGVKIDSWEVRYSEPREITEAEEQLND